MKVRSALSMMETFRLAVRAARDWTADQPNFPDRVRRLAFDENRRGFFLSGNLVLNEKTVGDYDFSGGTVRKVVAWGWKDLREPDRVADVGVCLRGRKSVFSLVLTHADLLRIADWHKSAGLSLPEPLKTARENFERSNPVASPGALRRGWPVPRR